MAKFNDPYSPMCKFKRKYLSDCEEALALPNNSADWLRKHDAEIREQMLDLFRGKHRDYANELAAELEAGK